jgi:hypothetical protein
MAVGCVNLEQGEKLVANQLQRLVTGIVARLAATGHPQAS